MKELSGFQRDLIHIIEGLGECKGLEIKDVLDDYRGETDTSRLYPNLNEVVEMEYVHKGSMDGRSNAYSLTEKGEQALEERREWEAELRP